VKSVAVIGQGFVGGTLATVLMERGCPVFVTDKAMKCAPGAQYRSSAERLAQDADIIFVCVPTPMRADGAADTSIVEGVLDELAAVPGERIAVVRSTVPPGSTEAWNKKYGDSLHVVFNPEFLTEANALDDMRNQKRIILGGQRPWINKVRLFYRQAFPTVPIVKTSSTMAEMVKYFTNVQLAARVVLSCELWQVCEALGESVDYDKVVEYAKLDPRLGGSHMDVPGNDGVPGARGHCFPKDLRALTAVAKSLGVSPTVMEALWAKNLEVIPEGERDWERMKGRAVVAEEAA
jgi:nucleotide sugar dehydrogenase